MVALKIEDIKAFTSQLFLGELFDDFLVREISITTFNSFSISGKVKKSYYSEQELAEQQIQEYSEWKVLKPICFSLIRGKRLPENFQIQLQLSPAQLETFLEVHQVLIDKEQVQGLHVCIRYENEQLYCVTGTSVNLFTLDKTLEHEWDIEIRDFLKKHQIACC